MGEDKGMRKNFMCGKEKLVGGDNGRKGDHQGYKSSIDFLDIFSDNA